LIRNSSPCWCQAISPRAEAYDAALQTGARPAAQPAGCGIKLCNESPYLPVSTMLPARAPSSFFPGAAACSAAPSTARAQTMAQQARSGVKLCNALQPANVRRLCDRLIRHGSPRWRQAMFPGAAACGAPLAQTVAQQAGRSNYQHEASAAQAAQELRALLEEAARRTVRAQAEQSLVQQALVQQQRLAQAQRVAGELAEQAQRQQIVEAARKRTDELLRERLQPADAVSTCTANSDTEEEDVEDVAAQLNRQMRLALNKAAADACAKPQLR